MELYRDQLGKKSIKVKNTVERGAVKKFAEAIGDFHPIFVDEKLGSKSRYGRNIAPPTFPRVFDYGVIEGLNLPNKGLIHGEQVFHYERPLLVGEDVYCYSIVSDYIEKVGKQGSMGILVIESVGEDLEGKEIFSSKSTIIINETVRKGMSV